MSLPPTLDPAVAAGYRRYVRQWCARAGAGPDPVTALIAEAAEAPAGTVPPRPNLAASAADVIAWAEATAHYHARRGARLPSPRRRAESAQRQRALRQFAAAIRSGLAEHAQPARPTGPLGRARALVARVTSPQAWITRWRGRGHGRI